MSADEAEPRKPLLVRCEPCGHVWPVVYLPMEAGLASRVMRAARCPMCGAGSRKQFFATQKRMDRNA